MHYDCRKEIRQNADSDVF